MNRRTGGAIFMGAIALFLAQSCAYLEDLGTGVEKSPAVLSGVVRDSLTGLPLPGVSLTCGGQSVESDADGRFRFTALYSGEKELFAALPLYRSVQKKVPVLSSNGPELDIRLLRVNRPPILSRLFPDPAKGKHPLSIRFKLNLGDPDRLLPFSTEALHYRLWLDTLRTPGLLAAGAVPAAPAATASFSAVLPDTLIRGLAPSRTYFWRMAVYDLLGDSAVLADTFRTRAAYAPCPAGMGLVENDSLRSGICMDSFEVTSRDYDSLMGVSPPSASRLPKVNIRPDSANAYCTRAGKLFCRKFALQAAISQYDGREYPYGAAYLPDSCNTSAPNAYTGAPENGGSRPGCANDYGIYDLSGNVAEWVDGYDYEDLILFPSDILGRKYAYYMGGFWASGSHSGRLDIDTTYTFSQPFIGFRCCATPQ